jgi:predicted RNase H-like HicB family nuclease
MYDNLYQREVSPVYYQITVILEEQPEGGYTVTSKDLPGLVTEGDSVEEALKNAKDAFITTLELYEDLGYSLPESVQLSPPTVPSKNTPLSCRISAAKHSDSNYYTL